MNRKNVLSRAHRHRNERSSGNFAHVGESVKTQISNDASPIGCAVGATTDHRHDADWPAVPVARWARDRRAPAGEELDERANWTTTTCWFLAWRAVYSAISALPAVLTSATRVPRSALSGRLDAGRTRTARRRGRQRPGASRDRARSTTATRGLDHNSATRNRIRRRPPGHVRNIASTTRSSCPAGQHRSQPATTR
jgi:hypothetical protein